MLHLVKTWLKVPVEERDAEGRRRMLGGKRSTRGTPQGGVISRLLATIYMHRFLRAWRQRNKGQQYRARLVTYADDFVIVSQGHAVAALAWTREVMGRIGLTLNDAKTSIRDARTESFDFGWIRGLCGRLCELGVKPVGQPDAGKLHVRFDERESETER